LQESGFARVKPFLPLGPRRTPPHSAALRRTPPHSAALRRTPPHSAAFCLQFAVAAHDHTRWSLSVSLSCSVWRRRSLLLLAAEPRGLSVDVVAGGVRPMLICTPCFMLAGVAQSSCSSHARSTSMGQIAFAPGVVCNFEAPSCDRCAASATSPACSPCPAYCICIPSLQSSCASRVVGSALSCRLEGGRRRASALGYTSGDIPQPPLHRRRECNHCPTNPSHFATPLISSISFGAAADSTLFI
jgi:hypothetical protein